MDWHGADSLNRQDDRTMEAKQQIPAIGHGDRVTFVALDGTHRTGKANGLLIFPSHLVLDMGGPHGSPQVVQRADVLRVTPSRRKGV
jgi:hypothetical protein